MNIPIVARGVGPSAKPARFHDVQNLGLFRLVLAALVVVQHYQKLVFGEPSGLWIESLEIGSLAVLVFFVLSGYVIVGAIDRFYRDRPVAFMANRLNRIVPLFVAVVAISALILLPLHLGGRLLDVAGEPAVAPYSVQNLLANLLGIVPLGHLLTAQSYEFVPIAWAVQTEMTFYLVVFAALIVARALKRSFGLVGWLIGAAFLGVATVRLLTGIGPDTLLLAPHFVLGGAFYYWRKSPAPLALLLAVAAAAFVAAELLARPDLHETVGFVRPHLVQLAILAGLVAVMVAGTYRNPVPKWLDRLAGDYSYPLYLCHLLPATVAVSLGALDQPGTGWLLAALVAALAFSTTMLWLVDRPMTRLRNRVRQVALA